MKTRRRKKSLKDTGNKLLLPNITGVWLLIKYVSGVLDRWGRT